MPGPEPGICVRSMQIVANAVIRGRSSIKSTNMEPILMYGGTINVDEGGRSNNARVGSIQAKGSQPQVVAGLSIAVFKPRSTLVPFSVR
jgi:branched-chain amino acid transport system substrate-binding protein